MRTVKYRKGHKRITSEYKSGRVRACCACGWRGKWKSGDARAALDAVLFEGDFHWFGRPVMFPEFRPPVGRYSSTLLEGDDETEEGGS